MATTATVEIQIDVPDGITIGEYERIGPGHAFHVSWDLPERCRCETCRRELPLQRVDKDKFLVIRDLELWGQPSFFVYQEVYHRCRGCGHRQSLIVGSASAGSSRTTVREPLRTRSTLSRAYTKGWLRRPPRTSTSESPHGWLQWFCGGATERAERGIAMFWAGCWPTSSCRTRPRRGLLRRSSSRNTAAWKGVSPSREPRSRWTSEKPLRRAAGGSLPN